MSRARSQCRTDGLAPPHPVRLGRRGLGDQAGQLRPGGAEIVLPAQGGLQVHPQPRGDRVRPDDGEADRFQPARRQHARRPLVVGADRLQAPGCPAGPAGRRPPGPAAGRCRRRGSPRPPVPTSSTAASWLTGVVANAPSRGTSAAGAIVRWPIDGAVVGGQHSAVAPAFGDRLGPLRLDAAAVSLPVGGGQVGQARLPEGAAARTAPAGSADRRRSSAGSGDSWLNSTTPTSGLHPRPGQPHHETRQHAEQRRRRQPDQPAHRARQRPGGELDRCDRATARRRPCSAIVGATTRRIEHASRARMRHPWTVHEPVRRTRPRSRPRPGGGSGAPAPHRHPTRRLRRPVRRPHPRDDGLGHPGAVRGGQPARRSSRSPAACRTSPTCRSTRSAPPSTSWW